MKIERRRLLPGNERRNVLPGRKKVCLSEGSGVRSRLAMKLRPRGHPIFGGNSSAWKIGRLKSGRTLATIEGRHFR